MPNSDVLNAEYFLPVFHLPHDPVRPTNQESGMLLQFLTFPLFEVIGTCANATMGYFVVSRFSRQSLSTRQSEKF